YQLTDSNNVDYYSNGGNSDFFITKFATQACTPLANETFESQNINLYPNPTNYAVELQNINQEYNYALYAITGVCVQKGSVSLENNHINVENLSSGIYVLQLDDKNGKLSSYKLIKD
uniref:T9SS type A sorting domain-containing protein n=1 Tax=uncultured Flavobacterium sp. TaxID=165435 RepID=UPI0030C825C6